MNTIAIRTKIAKKFMQGCALTFSTILVLHNNFSIAETAVSAIKKSSTPGDLPTELVYAIERDLGMNPKTYLEQAELGQKLASRSHELKTEFPSSFGGAWIDTKGVATIGILPGSTSESLHNKILASGFTASIITSDESFGATNTSSPYGLYSQLRPQQAADNTATENLIMGGDGYIAQSDGFALRCSLGFHAIDSGGNPVNISAGHCNPDGESAGATVSFLSGHRVGNQFGTFIKSSVSGNDYSIISLNESSASLFATNEIRDSNSFIDGTAEPIVGALVCKSAATTGFTCGRITAINQNLLIANNRSLNDVFATDMCALYGDSGGAVISGTKAVGIVGASTVAEFDSCEVADFATRVMGVHIQLFATPISAILAENPGLRLHH
ncbi:MAG: S1 family peptidase [Mycobacteriaceae bacterium]